MILDAAIPSLIISNYIVMNIILDIIPHTFFYLGKYFKKNPNKIYECYRVEQF